MTATSSTQNPMLRVLGIRDFRLLFTGAGTSLLGDQFALIATPWLVLQLTGDPLALGIVLALEGIPRAALMLVGGAITDRLSPRLIMFISDCIRLALTALLALAVFSGAVQMWMVYAFALGFGLVAGFFIPAGNSIVPALVPEQDLQAGNSLLMGVNQLTGFVGPSVAGILIGGYAHSFVGIGLAFAIDALSFAVSAASLWLIRARRAASLQPGKENLWASILNGIKATWADSGLRLLLIVMAAVNFLLIGPLEVGIPVLASQRLPEGAVAFGLLMSAYAGGSLGGTLLAGTLPRPSGWAFKAILLGLIGGFGLVIGALAFIPSTWVDFALMLLIGLGNGYIGISIFTWMQIRTPPAMMGRMVSLLMFASTGLAPISQAAAGAISKWNLSLLFLSSGALVLLATAWTAFQPGLKVLADSLAAGPAGTPASQAEI